LAPGMFSNSKVDHIRWPDSEPIVYGPQHADAPPVQAKPMYARVLNKSELRALAGID